MNTTTESRLFNNVVYYFIALLGICLLGFYKTYLIHFPSFEQFNNIHHFHGLMALLWIILLISQASLIRMKKYKLHRTLGKLAYVIMPLFIVSLFLISKDTYVKNLKLSGETEALAGMFSSVPDIFNFSICFILAMYFRKNAGFHMRFMTFTGIMMLGPGLGRFIIVFLGLPFPVVIVMMIAISLGTSITWLVADIKAKRSPLPLTIFLIMSINSILISIGSHSKPWLNFASWFASSFY